MKLLSLAAKFHFYIAFMINGLSMRKCERKFIALFTEVSSVGLQQGLQLLGRRAA